jgi:sugar phosphate isomerase/epimerase
MGEEQMKLGWCAPLKDAGLVRDAGYDYIELPLAAQDFSPGAKIESPLPVGAFNYFWPRDMRIVGEHVDDAKLDRYLGRAAEIMGGVGAKIAVMGSAWARNVPEGFERSRAEDQIVHALDRIADHLKGTGVTLAIEPLYAKESNIINSVAEGADLARGVNRPEIRVLADFFHMDEENEPLETLRDNRDWVVHVHLADTGRRNPGTGAYPYDRFFGILKETGYAGMMSGECQLDDPATDMRHSRDFLRRHWPN